MISTSQHSIACENSGRSHGATRSEARVPAASGGRSRARQWAIGSPTADAWATDRGWMSYPHDPHARDGGGGPCHAPRQRNGDNRGSPRGRVIHLASSPRESHRSDRRGGPAQRWFSRGRNLSSDDPPRRRAFDRRRERRATRHAGRPDARGSAAPTAARDAGCRPGSGCCAFDNRAIDAHPRRALGPPHARRRRTSTTDEQRRWPTQPGPFARRIAATSRIRVVRAQQLAVSAPEHSWHSSNARLRALRIPANRDGPRTDRAHQPAPKRTRSLSGVAMLTHTYSAEHTGS